ncbi:O-acyltransferase like protein-like isoform X2 [Crassostrea virginica]
MYKSITAYKDTGMKLQSLLLVCGVVLVCPGTMRPVSSQSLLEQVPMILKQMNSTQKIALMAEVLMKNPVLYDKLEHILVGALPLISTFSIKPELNKFMLPWVLDTIPKVLQNPLLLNITSRMVSDINKVNITGLNDSGIDPFMHGFMQRFSFVHSGLRAAVESFLISRGLDQHYARTIASKDTVILETYGLKVLDAVIGTVNAVDMSGVSTNDSRVIEAEFWKRFSLLSAAGKAVQVLTPVEQFLPKLDNTQLSDKCYNDTMIYLNSMLQGKKWAVKIFDAVGKPPTGTLTGNLHFIGSYDQCLAIKAEKASSSQHLSTTNTRYCRATFGLSEGLIASIREYIGDVDTHGVPLSLTWGLCLPASCQKQDVSGLFTLGFLRSYNLTPVVDCSESYDLGTDTDAIIMILILSIICLVCGIATIFHIYRFSEKEGKAEPSVSLSSDHVNEGYIPEVEETTFSPRIENGHINSRDTDFSSGKDQGWGERLVNIFSLYQNIPDVLSFDDHDDDSIGCVHGIRVLSLAWLVLGNSFLYAALSITSAPVTGNLLEGLGLMKGFTFQAVISSPFSIDSFFVISGFLLTIKFLRKCTAKGKVKWQAITGFYANRYIRITPVYLIIMMTYVCFYHYVGDSPLYPNSIGVADKCKQTWWHHILFVNNIIDNKGTAFEQCMPWSWFLACIMQFYLITPILFMFYIWSSAIGTIMVGLLLTASVVATAIKEKRYTGDIMSMMSDGGDYWNNVFITPWCRVGSYCIGLLLGFLFDTYDSSKVKIDKRLNILGWLVSLGMMITVVYSPFTKNREGGYSWSPLQAEVYEAMTHVVWSLSLSWLIFACAKGHGGAVNWVLSWRGFLPLSRLSYVVYLIHPVIMVLFIYNKKVLINMNTLEMSYLFLGHMLMSFAVGSLFSVGVEMPFRRLLKTLKKRGLKDRKNK